MKFTIASVAVAAVAAQATVITPSLITMFGDFMVEYNKTYADHEIAERMSIFARSLEIVDERNKENILAGGEAVHGVNQFSDISEEEFAATHLTYRPELDEEFEREDPEFNGTLATSIDWRTKGVLTSVKDQAHCGSCWAFSASESLESFYKIKGHGLAKLSPQQLTSCDKASHGCDGGSVGRAFRYLISAGGLESESSYPYTSGSSHKSGTCKFNKSKVAAKLSRSVSVSKGESNLKKAMNSGPPSVCLDAHTFKSYTGGVMKSCGTKQDHCVQGVGYHGSDYWILRNSWGTRFGEKGFIRIAQGKNLCLISNLVTYPQI